jgi:hypothetical protein
MLPANFNLVLTGENLPVQNISVGDFEFNHRGLKETVRFPMGIIAEARAVSLQILPDRIQATVTEVRDLARDAGNLLKMIEPIFDYVGQKSFAAVGHNAQFVLDPSIPKSAVAQATLNVGAIGNIIDGHAEAADINIFRHIPNGAMLRTSLLTQTPIDQVAIEFNAHFDVAGMNARESISQLPDSLQVMVEIAARAEASLQPQKVAGR